MFLSRFRNTSGSLEEREMPWELKCVSTVFRILPNFHECFNNLIETQFKPISMHILFLDYFLNNTVFNMCHTHYFQEHNKKLPGIPIFPRICIFFWGGMISWLAHWVKHWNSDWVVCVTALRPGWVYVLGWGILLSLCLSLSLPCAPSV